MQWDYLAIVAVSSLTSAAVLVIATLGLAVIFGLMGVINLAHGEFIMIGAYAALIATRQGMPLPVAFLFAALVAALFGAIVERLIVRHLYGRLLDTLLATWGLSLVLYQTAVLIFGSTTPGVGLPLTNVTIGRYSISAYFLFLVAAAAALLFLTYLVLTRTSYGIMARASIQDRETASAMGIETGRINTMTFAFGSGLAGLAGGLLVPAFPATPGMGIAFVAKAFLAVVVAGPLALSGTAVAAGALGWAASATASYLTTVMGDIIFFVATILLLHLFPSGISDKWRMKL
jgi:branched-chain amino acid transport system permease protein